MTSEAIPGLRRPTEQEKFEIGRVWGYEIEHHTYETRGGLVRFLAIFLIACAAVSVVRSGDPGGAIVTGLVGLAFYFVSGRLNKNRGNKKRRLQALNTGDYMVAEAETTQIGFSYWKHHKDGRVCVRLSNGRCLEGGYKMPYPAAKPYIEKQVHNIPILLIFLPGEENIWTIPARK